MLSILIKIDNHTQHH